MRFNIFMALMCLCSLNAFASNTINKSAVARLEKNLKRKSLVCEPADHNRPKDPAYRGDEGFFTVRVKKYQVEISNAGDSGYGFSNGNVIAIGFADSTQMTLNVGDDGSQTLIFDFSNIGADSEYADNCGAGFLVSQPDINLYSGDKVVCCLK